MRPRKPRSPTLSAITMSMTMNASHGSCGQYVFATTGARLKPISITTAPVTTGGRVLWITRAPAKWMIRPTMNKVNPTTKSAPERVAGLPPAE